MTEPTRGVPGYSRQHQRDLSEPAAAPGRAARHVSSRQASPSRSGVAPRTHPLPVQGPMRHDRQRLLFGLPVAALRLEEVVDLARSTIRHRGHLLIGVLNAAKIAKLRRDRFLRDSLLDCDLLLADGQSVVWASHLLGRPLPERVAGIDLFTALLDLADREQLRVYLLGARQGVLDTLRDRLAERWPGVVLAGSRNGYFDDSEAAEVAAQIAEARADLLFLGMTTPKKEIFFGAYGDTMNVPVSHGVGGSFDVLAGFTRRAPLRWQRMGMEWAYRLLQEPRRMWRRYLVTNTVFLAQVMGERMHRRAAYERSAPSTVGESQ